MRHSIRCNLSLLERNLREGALAKAIIYLTNSKRCEMSDPTINAPYFDDDDAAREYLESVRWPDGPICPHCGSVAEHYRLNGKGGPKGKKARPGLLCCACCAC